MTHTLLFLAELILRLTIFSHLTEGIPTQIDEAFDNAYFQQRSQKMGNAGLSRDYAVCDWGTAVNLNNGSAGHGSNIS